MPNYVYENTRRIIYESSTGKEGAAYFLPVCPNCGRYVKADKKMNIKYNKYFNEERFECNATCKKCGRIIMPFDGYY